VTDPDARACARPARSSRIVTLAAVTGVAVTASLGVWQMNRAAQKQAAAALLAERAAMPPLADLPSSARESSALWHRRVTLRGRWMAPHTVYLDNRQMALRPGDKPRVGFDVLTPLGLADGSAIVVQRGWVPRDFLDRGKLVAVPTPDGEVVVEGRYAPPPPRLYAFEEVPTPRARVRQNLDLDAYAHEIDVSLRPGSIVQTGDDAASGVVHRSWSMPASGVERHHGYAFQWFGLSALLAGLYVWFQLIQPRRQRRRARP
jgi:surfeit locus 1 family protein